MPIEVFIPKIEEYESDLCNRILPELDARCIYMKNQLMNPNKDNLDSFANKFEFKGYQYKALAILLSSFENVLLLDSDNIPAHSPEELFEMTHLNLMGWWSGQTIGNVPHLHITTTLLTLMSAKIFG